MHKLKQLSASSFLRLLFAAFTFAFLCSAFIAPDRAEMFTGLRRIMTESPRSRPTILITAATPERS